MDSRTVITRRRVMGGVATIVGGILGLVGVSFVLGLGNTQYTNPEVDFMWSFTSANGQPHGVVTITHAGGNKVRADEVYIRGEGFSDAPSMEYDLSEAGGWAGNGQISGTKSGHPAITEGDSIEVGAHEGYHFVISWNVDEGPAAKLGENKGRTVNSSNDNNTN